MATRRGSFSMPAARAPRATTSPADENLLIRAFRDGLRASARARRRRIWRIEVSSMIPAARGLGSSAAAIVAGLVLGAAVGRQHGRGGRAARAWASALEGHPDNVAAALYGGFTVAVADERAGDPAPLPRAGGMDPGGVHLAARESHTRNARGTAGDHRACGGGSPGRSERTAGGGDHDLGRRACCAAP